MTKERKDRRVERSKAALRAALIELMIEQGLERTTVSQITERANVGRSTFYAHYADKEDLLKGSIDALKDFLQSHQATARPSRGPAVHPALSFSLPMIEHADTQRELFRALVGRRSGAMVMEYFHDMLTDLVRKTWRKSGTRRKAASPPDEVVFEFIVGSYLSVLHWWLVSDSKLNPRELDVVYRSLVRPGLDAIPA